MRPGAGGLEYLGSFPLNHGGNNLRIHSFRVTGVTGQPSGSQDPDQECSRWDWHDVNQGLPEHVEKNLYNQQDVTLQALGFQKGPMRKFEVPPPLDLRMPTLARLLKAETKTGDREQAKEVLNLTRLVVHGVTNPEGLGPGNIAAHRAALQQLHEMNLPSHAAALVSGDREEVKLALRSPNVTRRDREIVLQRTLGDESLLINNSWMKDIMEPLASSWDEDQRVEMIRRTAGLRRLLPHLLGPGDLSDAERAAMFEKIVDPTDPNTSSTEERIAAQDSARKHASWAMGLLRPNFIAEESWPGFGFDKLTPDQLDQLNDFLEPGSWHANEILKHPNLGDATIEHEMDRLRTLQSMRKEPTHMSGIELGTMAILNNPKVSEDDAVAYVRSNLHAGVFGRDMTNSVEDLKPAIIDRVAADIMHHAVKTSTDWTSLLEKHYVKPSTSRPMPKDAKEAMIHLDATGTHQLGFKPLRAIRNMWLDTPHATLADRKQILREAKRPFDGDDAISMPRWGDEKLRQQIGDWHQDLMANDDTYDVEAARQSDRPVPPEYLKKIDNDLAAGGHSKRLDQLFDDDRPFQGLEPGVADLLAKHAPTNDHAAQWLSSLPRGNRSVGIESRHLDPLLKDLSPDPRRVGFRHQVAAHAEAITGQQLFDFLQRPDTQPVNGALAVTQQGDKLSREHVKALADHPFERIASQAAARLHPDDISSYIRRPGHQQRVAVLENLIKKNPNFHIGHMQEMKDNVDPMPGTNQSIPQLMLDKVISRPDATSDMLRFLYHNQDSGVTASNLLSHPNLPADVLKDIEKRVRNTPVKDEDEDVDQIDYDEDDNEIGRSYNIQAGKPGSLERLVHISQGSRSVMQERILRHPNLDLDHLQDINEAYTADHQGLQTPGVADHLSDAIEKHHPDLLYTQKVTLKPGTERLREIRDIIAEREPEKKEMSPKHLPPGDWSPGRSANGNISARLLQQHIDQKPGQTFNLSATTWTGAQRHNAMPSKVLQVNITTKHRQELREKGLRGIFDRMMEDSTNSDHPVTPHTIGWVRYTGNKKSGYFIDEIQSDFGGSNGRTHVQLVRSEARKQAEKVGLTPERAAAQIQEAVSAAQERWPEDQELEVNKVLFGGRPPNQILHEAFLQHLRDTGYEGAPVHMHSVATKALLALGRSDQPVPAHMKETYGEQPRKMGYKPVRYGDIPATDLNIEPEMNGYTDEGAPGDAKAGVKAGAVINGTKIRKAEDDGLRAAFRDQDGKVTITGSIHDLFQLPSGLDTDVSTIESGYVDDDDGKFYTREQLKHPEPIEKKERSFETNVGMWLLSKMAVAREDLKPVANHTSAGVGSEMIDDKKELKAHPGHLEPVVSAFKTHIIDSPKVVKRGHIGSTEAGNSTGKVVYDLDNVDLGPLGARHRFMVKPYHEKIITRLRPWHHAPTQGWAEMTDQALYHSAGIGHLHQEVHVAHMPILGKGTQPALVIRMQPGVRQIEALRKPVYSPLGSNQGVRADVAVGLSPEQQEHARRIGIMDFLSNNLDRHSANLLVDAPNNRLIAIDQSRSFQYKTSDKMGPPRSINAPIDDSLGNYLGQRGSRLGHAIGLAIPKISNYMYEVPPELAALTEQRQRGQIGWFDETGKEVDRQHRDLEQRHHHKQIDAWTDAWSPTFEWWGQHAGAVKDTFKKRLALVKDKTIRNHMWRNFQARLKVLNEYARDGHENYGQDDWENFQVPIFRLGTNLHRNDEFSHWFEKDV